MKMGTGIYPNTCCRAILTSVFLLVQLSGISSQYFISHVGPEQNLPYYQQYCQRRQPESCCPGRDDYCTMPIGGLYCYCDIFCNRTVADCCPDFWGHCHNIEPPTGAQTFPPELRPCDILPCQNGGVCYPNGEHDFTCICAQGWTGKLCDQNTNAQCLSNPCLHGATCKGVYQGYYCICRPGYYGVRCQSVIAVNDPCSPSPCRHGGRCKKSRGGYTCKCPQGYIGQHCENLDELNQTPCLSNPCKNGGVCDTTPGGFICRCRPGFTGPLCGGKQDPCLSSPCRNGGVCRATPTGYHCTCPPGWGGKYCELDTDPCRSRPCRNGGACIPRVSGGYECRCPAGFAGKNCDQNVNPCTSNPCRNGGQCVQTTTGYHCICTAGYEGRNCETMNDPCRNSPCRNGGQCFQTTQGFTCVCDIGWQGQTCQTRVGNPCVSNPCTNGGRCKRTVSGFHCTCAAGFGGPTCNIITDPCINRPCANGGRCTATTTGFTCVCRYGWEGKTCREKTQTSCSPNPCRNGGQCHVSVGGYYCLCQAGFEGKNCDSNANDCASNPCRNGGRCQNSVQGYHCICVYPYDGVNCEKNTDPCRSNPCRNGGECQVTVEGYFCRCRPGYGGPNCAEDMDPCRSRPCRNGGRCIGHLDGYICNCPEGYGGQDCAEDLDECASNPCLNGGRCRDRLRSYVCDCTSGWGGQRCEIDMNPCKSDPCMHGECQVTGSSYICVCEPGYEGVNCQSEVYECGSNPCQNGVCSDTVNGYTCECDIGFTGPMCDRGPDQCVMNEEPEAPQGDESEGAVRFGDQPNSREEYQNLPRSISIRSNFTLEFKSSSADGILFYMSDSRQEDFVGLFLKSGRLYHAFDCGSGGGFMSSRRSYNDGKWHTVSFSRERKDGQLVVDGSDMSQGMSTGTRRTMSVSPPYYVGGVSGDRAESRELSTNLQGVTNSLSGCIRNFKLGDSMLGGPRGYQTGPCSSSSEPGSFFYSGGGYLVAAERFVVGLDLTIAIDVRARSLNGVILSVRSSQGEYLVLQIVDGKILFNVNNGDGDQEISATWDPNEKGNNKNFLCDGQWHSIIAVKAKEVVTLRVDMGGLAYGTGTPGISLCETNDPLYVGGYGRFHAGIRNRADFVGCIKNLRLNDRPSDFTAGRQSGRVNVNSCPLT